MTVAVTIWQCFSALLSYKNTSAVCGPAFLSVGIWVGDNDNKSSYNRLAVPGCSSYRHVLSVNTWDKQQITIVLGLWLLRLKKNINLRNFRIQFHRSTEEAQQMGFYLYHFPHLTIEVASLQHLFLIFSAFPKKWIISIVKDFTNGVGNFSLFSSTSFF